jgi:ATP-dependent RNA helicase DeaD
MSNQFLSLGVRADLVEGLDALDISTPTPVQQAVIPFLLGGGGDLIAQAQTGTGKTAAFGIPLLTKVDPELPKIQGLIIAPTRELAKQIGKALFRYTKFCSDKLFVEVAAGGDKIELQMQRLDRPTHILVATPGRLMDLFKKGLLLDAVHTMVLDEADEMLSMGFQQELTEIFKQTTKRKATWLFSATFQKKLHSLIENYMSPHAHRVQVEPQQIVNRNIEHQYAICAREEKDAFIINYLRAQGTKRGLIFCRTRAGSIRMGEELEKAGLSVAVIQGDLSQRDRDKVMRAFKKERVQFLVATDVAARGIDVEGLSFVIQHQLPDALQYYTHRSGRTARAGKKGVSLTLIEPGERSEIKKLETELSLNFSLVE